MSHVLYRYWNEDSLLYVGLTSDPERRNGEHAGHSEWWEYASTITIERYETRELLEEAETQAIREEMPLYNIAQNTLNPYRVRKRRPSLPKFADPRVTEEYEEEMRKSVLAALTDPRLRTKSKRLAA